MTTPVSSAVILTLAEPMTAGSLGVLVVGETLGSLSWCGLLMVLSGLFSDLSGAREKALNHDPCLATGFL